MYDIVLFGILHSGNFLYTEEKTKLTLPERG